MKENVPEHACPVCGKMTKNKTVCSKQCNWKWIRNKSRTRKDKFNGLDDTNRCAQCHKEMPIDRYSMYCEECEMHIGEIY